MNKVLVTGQYRRIATINFDAATMNDLAPYALSLPEGSLIFGGSLVVTKPFNTGGADTLAFGTETDPDRNLAATSLKAAAVTALTSNQIANGDRLLFTRAAAGSAATEGEGYLYVEFMAPRINDFNVGDVWEPWVQSAFGS